MRNHETTTAEFEIYGLKDIADFLNDADFLNMGEGETASVDNYEINCVENETMLERDPDDDSDMPYDIRFAVKVDGEFWQAIVEVWFKKETLDSPAELAYVELDDFWIYENVIHL